MIICGEGGPVRRLFFCSTFESRLLTSLSLPLPLSNLLDGGAGVTFSAGDMFMGQCLARNLARDTKTDVFCEFLLAYLSPNCFVALLNYPFFLSPFLSL